MKLYHVFTQLDFEGLVSKFRSLGYTWKDSTQEPEALIYPFPCDGVVFELNDTEYKLMRLEQCREKHPNEVILNVEVDYEFEDKGGRQYLMNLKELVDLGAER